MQVVGRSCVVTGPPPSRRRRWPVGRAAARRRCRTLRDGDSGALRVVDDPAGEAVPADMRAWVIRPERLGEPIDAMQLETVEVPEPGPGEVLVRVMAAGVNYNLVWAAMGKPVSIFRYTGDDFHIGGSDASGHRRGGRTRRAALEARRRGRHPLQPVVRRVPGVQRPRPDGLHGAEDLGLRDQLGLVRRVHPRPGAAARAEAEAPVVGGGGVVRARLLHGVPDAGRPGRRAGRRQRARLGRGRRARVDGAAALPPVRRERRRGRLVARTRSTCASASARPP